MTTITDLFAGGPVSNHAFYNAAKGIHSRLRSTVVNENNFEEIKNLNFGIAAKSGTGLRAGLLDIMPNPNDKSMQDRLQCAIAKWLGKSIVGDLTSCNEVPFVNNFPFTPEQDFNKIFQNQFTINQPQENLITVRLEEFVPASAIIAPAGTTDVELIISVAACMLRGGTPTGSKTIAILIPFKETRIPAHLLKFPIHMPAGSLTVTAVRAIYYNRKKNTHCRITETELMPAAILNARYFF
jgi:hypothetical protein